MEKSKDPLFSDNYKTTDFVWGQTLGEGKLTAARFAASFPVLTAPCRRFRKCETGSPQVGQEEAVRAEGHEEAGYHTEQARRPYRKREEDPRAAEPPIHCKCAPRTNLYR